VHALYGMALLETGDPEAAAREFRRELEKNPNEFDSNLNLGALLRQERRLEEALPFLQHALRVRPKSPAARYQLAALYADLGRLEDARRMLEDLVAASPSFVEARVTLARVYYRLKRKEDGDRQQELIRKLTAQQGDAKSPGAASQKP